MFAHPYCCSVALVSSFLFSGFPAKNGISKRIATRCVRIIKGLCANCANGFAGVFPSSHKLRPFPDGQESNLLQRFEALSKNFRSEVQVLLGQEQEAAKDLVPGAEATPRILAFRAKPCLTDVVYWFYSFMSM